jgi:hypothetical protein
MKTLIFLFLISNHFFVFSDQLPYLWLSENSPDTTDRIANIEPPMGFIRSDLINKSFAQWLRNLPLKKQGTKLHLYNGTLKQNQMAHYRIINIDTGIKNLQQCADAVIRLRAEYLYVIGDINNLHFNFTSGDTARFREWEKGFRPVVNQNEVKWVQNGPVADTYSNFKNYLETVFTYSGSYSLQKELIAVDKLKNIIIGDVFIQGGFPGHAILVVDKTKSITDNRIAVLLAQSYMPAQDIHILRNPNDPQLNPWYILNENDKLYTPEWTFEWHDLYRFK